MGPGHHICPRCGSAEWAPLSVNRSRCGECGLGSTSAPLVASGDPDPGAAEQQARIDELLGMMEQRDPTFANAPFPVYGLDATWTGVRSYGGWGNSDGVVANLSLAFGDVGDQGAPHVRVETERGETIGVTGRRDPTFERFMAAHQLVQQLSHEVGELPEDVRTAAFPNGRRDSRPSDPTGPWDDATIRVDAAPVDAKVLTIRDRWIALVAVDDLYVSISAHRWDLARVGLVTVTDFAVYADGSAEIRRRMRERHRGAGS